MSSRKKYQVFVSSTYLDLKEERQAAVMAILTSGNIPAGMELFSSGDESQMEVIKRWIDNSDMYLLILGSRYGSIEPKSGKSYTQIEYEYAIEQKKPFFALILHEEADKFKKEIIKLNDNELAAYSQFRKLVELKHIRYWHGIEGLQLEIYKSIQTLTEERLMVGWVRSTELHDYGSMGEALAKMSEENRELRGIISEYEKSRSDISGLSYSDMFDLLNVPIESELTQDKEYGLKDMNEMQRIRDHFKHREYMLLHYLWIKRIGFGVGATYPGVNYTIVSKLIGLGLLRVERKTTSETYHLTESGIKFLAKLSLELKKDKFY